MAGKGIILLVEDDIDLNNANRRALELRGYTVYTALTLAGAREQLKKIIPDIILLDVVLPDGDGFDFCLEVRGSTQAHILFLTSKTEQEDMVKGFTTGGDDYIKKPFHPRELMARVEAAMRRREIGVPVKTLTKGPLTLNLVSAQVFLNGRDLLFSQKDFTLLLLFAQNEGKIMSADYIYENAWGQPMVGDSQAVQIAISRLRKKIGPAGYIIPSVRGQGYVFKKG